MSGGRFILGLGAGWKEDEYEAYGYPFPDTKTRLEELEEGELERFHEVGVTHFMFRFLDPESLERFVQTVVPHFL